MNRKLTTKQIVATVIAVMLMLMYTLVPYRALATEGDEGVQAVSNEALGDGTHYLSGSSRVIIAQTASEVRLVGEGGRSIRADGISLEEGRTTDLTLIIENLTVEYNRNMMGIDLRGAEGYRVNLLLSGKNSLYAIRNAIYLPEGVTLVVDKDPSAGQGELTILRSSRDNTDDIIGGGSPPGDFVMNNGVLNVRGVAHTYGQSRRLGTAIHARSITINGGEVRLEPTDMEFDYWSGAIGGEYTTDIIINGGKVYAEAGEMAAGIGGHQASITINGGDITAYGAPRQGLEGMPPLRVDGEGGSAGIGTGLRGLGSPIVINGGNVKAYGGAGSAGIGGGHLVDNVNISITGGVVHAESGHAGAGIGGGSPFKGYNSGTLSVRGEPGTISISGGTVTAVARGHRVIQASGIGPGFHGYNLNIDISGGQVTATGIPAIGYNTSIGMKEPRTLSLRGGLITATATSGPAIKSSGDIVVANGPTVLAFGADTTDIELKNGVYRDGNGGELDLTYVRMQVIGGSRPAEYLGLQVEGANHSINSDGMTGFFVPRQPAGATRVYLAGAPAYAQFVAGDVASTQLTFDTQAAAIRKIAISKPSLSLPFDKNVYEYSLEVPAATDSLSLSITSNQTVPEHLKKPIPLEPGNNTIVVEATPSASSKEVVVFATYTLHVYRSTPADLGNIFFSTGVLDKPFSRGVTEYTLRLSDAVPALVVVATSLDPLSSVTVNGIATSAINPVATLLLDDDSTLVEVICTAADETSKTYTINLDRQPVLMSGPGFVPEPADLDDAVWAREEMSTMVYQGLLSPVDEASFLPNGYMTRADFLWSLMRVLDMRGVGQGSFGDVSETDLYYDEVSLAKALGITAGTGGNLFSPSTHVSRQDMMVMAARALRALGLTVPAGNSAMLYERFGDAADACPAAVAELAAIVEAGLIAGRGNNLAPQASATRAEVAVFLSRVQQMVK